MGFAGGFASLLVLRIMLGIGESISFPGSSKIIARHVPAERRGSPMPRSPPGIALGPAVGTLAGGLILGAMGLARDLPHLRDRHFAVAAAVAADGPRACRRPAITTKAPASRSARCWRNGRCGRCRSSTALGNYCFYFLLAWLPLFLTKSRGFSIGEMTMLATLGYAVQGACALELRPFFRLVDALGPLRGRCAAAG